MAFAFAVEESLHKQLLSPACVALGYADQIAVASKEGTSLRIFNSYALEVQR